MTRRLTAILLLPVALGLSAAAPVHADAKRTRVAVELSASPLADAPRPASPLTRAELRALREGAPRHIRQSIATAGELRRERQVRELQPAVSAAERALFELAQRLERHGGRVDEIRRLSGAVVADLRADQINAVRRWSDVGAVTPEPELRDAAYPVAVQEIRAPAAWAAGFTGGTGPSDVFRAQLGEPQPFAAGTPQPASPDAPDVAIVNDFVVKDNPIFAGVNFLVPENHRTAPDGAWESHGTQVAGVLVGRGVPACPPAPYVCTPQYDVNPDYRGAAPGVDKVLDPAAMYATNEDAEERYSDDAWALGFSQVGYETRRVLPGASDIAEVFNLSAAAIVDDRDYVSIDQDLDGLVDMYNVAYFQGAGNEGTRFPVSCRAYNVVCVGATDWADRLNPVAPVMAEYSSRGPTYGGRKKPDLVAPGAVVTANANWRQENSVFDGVEGTSFASPIAAGAGLILEGAGVTDPKAVKALLINSARPGRATPASAMGTQTTWQPDWGWGMVDVSAALGQRANFDVDTLDGDSAAFYAVTQQAAGDKATLVWNRRVTGCYAGGQVGCGYGAGGGRLVDNGLKDLNLYEHPVAPAGQCETAARASSASAIDNVEQLRAPSAASTILRVAPATNGAFTEPFAIAGTRQLTRLTAPRPIVTAQLSRDRILPGESATVTVTATHPGGALCATDTKIASLQVSGPAVVTDSTAQATDNEFKAGDTLTRTFTVKATSHGPITISAAAAGCAYGSTLTGRKQLVLTAAPPAPSAPTNVRVSDATPTSLRLAWTDTASTGPQFEIDRATSQAFTDAIRTVQPAGSTELIVSALSPGTAYFFRIRATNETGASPWTSFTASTAALAAPASVTAVSDRPQVAFVAWWFAPNATATGIQIWSSPGSVDTG